MGEKQPKGGKRHRKYGRAGRRPAHKRYNAEERWVRNKERRIAKQARLEAKKRVKLEERKNR